MRSSLVLIVLALLYLLHYDFWLWRRPEIVLGLPVGLLYQLAYCLLVAFVLALLLDKTWNRHRDSGSPGPTDP